MQRSRRPATNCSAPRRSRNSYLLLRNQFPDSMQFLGAQVLIFEQIQDEQFRGIAEKTAHQVTDGVPSGLIPAHHRGVAERASLVRPGVPQVALLFQNPQGGQYGVIGEAEL